MTNEEIEESVNELLSVETLTEIESLALETEAVFIKRLDDTKIKTLSKLKSLRRLAQDGVSYISDNGLQILGQMPLLKELDLEWSELITDEGLEHLKHLKNLRWLDVGFCRNITGRSVELLREALPACEIVQ